MRDGPQHFTVESEVESLRRRNRELEKKLAQQTRALERRVQERTAQLSHVVEALRAEVAERERMEQELCRGKERYHMLAANFPNGAVMMLDRDLRYVLAEGAGLEAVGISKEFLVGKTIWEALPLETAAALEPHYRAALAGTAAIFEAPCSGHTYLVHAVPLRNEEREICGAMAMTQDITAQKRAEATQRSQRDFISAVIETAAALVVVLDREGHVVQFNRACQETSGYSFDEVKGKSAWEIPLLFPEETIELRGVFSRLAAGQFPNWHENYWLTKDGRRQLIAWSNTALLGPDGSVEYVIATGIDITEQRRAEEELKARMRQQTAVVDLGQQALTGRSISSLLEEAVALVANTLALDYCSVLERLPSGDTLVIKAGFGWEPGLLERATVPAGSGSPAGYALLCNEPVVFDDLQHESRFEAPALLREHGIAIVAVVPITVREPPFGVMHALSTTPRTYSIHDLRFLQSVANILATAIERQSLEKKVLEASESEQRRIGQDLHDSLCQQLIGGELHAAVLRQTLAESSPAEAGSAAQLAKLFRDLATHAREIARGLAPVEITGGGFATALRKLAKTVRDRSGIPCRVRSDKGVAVSDSLIATHLYRIAQEAVQNALKHSHASGVSITVHADKGKIILTVKDDGIGLPIAAAKSEGMGLHTMRYRAAIINASLAITSGRKGGTTVTCSLEAPAARA